MPMVLYHLITVLLHWVTVFGKIFDRIVMIRYEEALATSELQFGF